jgi:hypothetical protein
MSAGDKGTTIIDAHDHATAMTDTNARSERQGSMCRSQAGAIQALAICCSAAAKTISSTINARHFCSRCSGRRKQQRDNKHYSQVIAFVTRHDSKPPERTRPKQKRGRKKPQTTSKQVKLRLFEMAEVRQLCLKGLGTRARDPTDRELFHAVRLIDSV